MKAISPTTKEVIERYKKNIQIWKVAARHDFERMSQDDGLEDIKEEYYSGWSKDQFIEVINEMKKHGG